MFSGIGGFEYGIQQAHSRMENEWKKVMGAWSEYYKGEIKSNPGANIPLPQRPDGLLGGCSCPENIGYSEIDKYAIQIYEKQFKGHKNYGNCREIKWEEVEDFDMLVGGFPCQAFSIAGKRGGFDDTRGTLFFEIARCLKEKQPRNFLIENVKGLLSHDKGNTFLTIITTLDELGYDLQWQVLNSKNFGVPQNRERVFIVGHLRGTSRPEVFPITRQEQEVERSNTKISNLEWVADFMGDEGLRIRPEKLANTLQAQARQDGTAGQTLIKVGKIRRLTPTECERLQGFPDGWTKGISDTQRYKCLGNAVTVNVIEAIMEKL